MVHPAVKASQVIKESKQLGLFLVGLDTKEQRNIITGLEHLRMYYTGKQPSLHSIQVYVKQKRKLKRKVIKIT